MISSPIATSATCWTRSGSASPQSTNGSPSASSVSACPAPHASPSRTAARRPPSRSVDDDARDRGEVVGVGGVAQPEQQRDEEGDGDAALRPHSAIRSSSPNIGSPFRHGGRRDGRLPEGDPAVVGREPAGDEHPQPALPRAAAGCARAATRFWNTPPESTTVPSPRSAAMRAQAAAVASASPWWKRAAIRPVATPARTSAAAAATVARASSTSAPPRTATGSGYAPRSAGSQAASSSIAACPS